MSALGDLASSSAGAHSASPYGFGQQDNSRRLQGIAFVIAVHLVVGYVLISGLGRQGLALLKKPLEAVIIQEVIIPPAPASPAAQENRAPARDAQGAGAATALCTAARYPTAGVQHGTCDSVGSHTAAHAACDCATTTTGSSRAAGTTGTACATPCAPCA